MLDLRHRHRLAAEVDGAVLENEGYSMITSGSWTAGYFLDKNPRLQWGYAPMPKGPLGTRPSSQTWTNMWSIARPARQKDVAREWLSFVNAEDTLERYFATVNKAPRPQGLLPVGGLEGGAQGVSRTRWN